MKKNAIQRFPYGFMCLRSTVGKVRSISIIRRSSPESARHTFSGTVQVEETIMSEKARVKREYIVSLETRRRTRILAVNFVKASVQKLREEGFFHLLFFSFSFFSTFLLLSLFWGWTCRPTEEISFH